MAAYLIALTSATSNFHFASKFFRSSKPRCWNIVTANYIGKMTMKENRLHPISANFWMWRSVPEEMESRK